MNRPSSIVVEFESKHVCFVCTLSVIIPSIPHREPSLPLEKRITKSCWGTWWLFVVRAVSNTWKNVWEKFRFVGVTP